jgi:hypothetical protein
MFSLNTIMNREVLEPIVPTSKYKYAMVCSSNVNRSVMAQIALTAQKMSCDSYGIGT